MSRPPRYVFWLSRLRYEAQRAYYWAEAIFRRYTVCRREGHREKFALPGICVNCGIKLP